MNGTPVGPPVPAPSSPPPIPTPSSTPLCLPPSTPASHTSDSAVGGDPGVVPEQVLPWFLPTAGVALSSPVRQRAEPSPFRNCSRRGFRVVAFSPADRQPTPAATVEGQSGRRREGTRWGVQSSPGRGLDASRRRLWRGLGSYAGHWSDGATKSCFCWRQAQSSDWVPFACCWRTAGRFVSRMRR